MRSYGNSNFPKNNNFIKFQNLFIYLFYTSHPQIKNTYMLIKEERILVILKEDVSMQKI